MLHAFETIAESRQLPTIKTIPPELLEQILGHVEDYRIACRKRYNDLESQNKHQFVYLRTVNRSLVSGLNYRRDLAPPLFFADHLSSSFNSTRRMRLTCKAFNRVLTPLVFKDIEITPRWLFALHRGIHIVNNQQYRQSMEDFLENMCQYTEHISILHGDINRTNGARYKLEKLIRVGKSLQSLTYVASSLANVNDTRLT